MLSDTHMCSHVHTHIHTFTQTHHRLITHSAAPPAAPSSIFAVSGTPMAPAAPPAFAFTPFVIAAPAYKTSARSTTPPSHGMSSDTNTTPHIQFTHRNRHMQHAYTQTHRHTDTPTHTNTHNVYTRCLTPLQRRPPPSPPRRCPPRLPTMPPRNLRPLSSRRRVRILHRHSTQTLTRRRCRPYRRSPIRRHQRLRCLMWRCGAIVVH